MPIVLDAAPHAALGEPDDKAAVPIEDRAAGIKSQHLDAANPCLLSPNCARALPAL